MSMADYYASLEMMPEDDWVHIESMKDLNFIDTMSSPDPTTWQWKTRDGRFLQINEIETAHLKNIIAFSLRRADELEGIKHPFVLKYWRMKLVPWLQTHLDKRKDK